MLYFLRFTDFTHKTPPTSPKPPRWIADTVVAGACDALEALIDDEVERVRGDQHILAQLLERARRRVAEDASVCVTAFEEHVLPHSAVRNTFF